MARRWLVSSSLAGLALVGAALFVRGTQLLARQEGDGRAAAADTRPGARDTAAAAPRRAPAVAPPARDTSPAAGHGGGHGAHGGGHAAIDWANVSARDLDVAAVFLTARDRGVRAALDSLRALAARDRAFRSLGHVVAHSLGRFAVARNGNDPAVYAECREDFQAGCFHGVLEAYFTSARAAPAAAVAPRALDALCPSIVPPGPARLPLLECAHGMGHGLTARARNDYRAALRSCDALSDADARGECHDGVFMEVTVRGTEPGGVAPDGTPLLRRDDPRYPCDSVAAEHQPSCWKYQPIVALEFTDDLTRTIRLCGEAPPASRAACHHGVGKQSVGWLAGAREVVAACRVGSAEHLGACLAGAAESYIDETWTPGPALALCRQAPADAPGAKAECYRAVGTRMALVRPAAGEVARDCAGAEAGYVEACVRGAAPRRP